MSTVSQTEFCKRVDKLIALEKATIKHAKEMISFLTAEIGRLKAAPHPDLEKIGELEKRLAEQQQRLAGAESGLEQALEDRRQFCSPHQPPL
jgi:predicted  nucleic acid-binding Zn-ribbon protein